MAYFESVEKMMHVTDGDRQICLCHFPIAEWNGYHKGHWYIYGHIHGRVDDIYYFMKNKDFSEHTKNILRTYYKTQKTLNSETK